MSFKKIRVTSCGKRQELEKKLLHERLSSQNDTMISCTEARLNLLHDISELKAQLDINRSWQI